MQTQLSKGSAAWKTAPFLRLLIPLITGILLEENFPSGIRFLIPVFVLSFFLSIFYNSIPSVKLYRVEWMAGLAIQILLLGVGRTLFIIHQDTEVDQSACFSKPRSNILVLKILNDPVQKPNSYKVIATVRWLIANDTFYYENEKLLVYFNNKSDMHQIEKGSLILIRKRLISIENFNTEFDYKRYCRLRHIYAQVYLNKNEFMFVQKERERFILSFLDSLRKKMMTAIKTYVLGKSETGLLEALMVGFSDDLDPELLKSYSNTGVIHIIAISGLHLALLCQILQFGLYRIAKNKNSKWLRFFVLVLCLWGYSFLSGSSPSVIRAATMFTLVLFANQIVRESSLYNSLAASAFLLICFDPNWLWDTGFQLSYAAVFSLRLFSKPIQNLIQIKNKLLANLWEAASVSIAAQILTTPISIYYFHQFPVYFLLANLLAVPLSSIILLGGILLCTCSWIPYAGQLLGWSLEMLIKLMNRIIQHIAHLPYAVIPNLTLSLSQLSLLYTISLCVYQFLIYKRKFWLLAGLAAIFLFQMIRLIQ